MELDRALELAVILGWEDMSQVATPSLVRIEYEFAPGASLDHLSIWLIKPKGYQDLVYEHWAKASWGHPAGTRLANGHCSQQLVRALSFILGNQEQFPHDRAKRRILVYPPGEVEHQDAATWMRGLPADDRLAVGGVASEVVPQAAQLLAQTAK